MSAGYKIGYRIMYRLGITPWVHGEPPEPLAALVGGPRSLPPGDMLDIGCGTGQDAIYAARHNWNVIGLDVVPRALEQARSNARAAGAAVRFLCCDIAQAGPGEVGGNYTLLLDGGCLHGLAPAQLRHATATITDAAKPGAVLLMFAFAPGRRGPAPRGIDPAEVPALFPQWDLEFSRPATEIELRGPLRGNASPSWYQLVRR
jgi:SAM-dependent methyltransferase